MRVYKLVSHASPHIMQHVLQHALQHALLHLAVAGCCLMSCSTTLANSRIVASCCSRQRLPRAYLSA